MSDIKLFRFGAGKTTELVGTAMQVEKSLQDLFQSNLDSLLGIRFLASEYSTGIVHGGRIDTLGVDEDGCPIIIEYKRSVNENVINQGLYYLDWLMDHRKEFEWLVLDKLGSDVARSVDWSAPRLLCIAGDFSRYDSHAVKQINRNIELLRYRRFGDDLLMIELVHAPKQSRTAAGVLASPALPAMRIRGEGVSTGPKSVEVDDSADDRYASQRIGYKIANAPQELRDLYEAIHTFLSNLGDDVQVKELKYYVAFKRLKNFACVELYPQVKVVTVYLKLDPTTVAPDDRFVRDVRKVGHSGTGDLELSIRSFDDFLKSQTFFQRAYENG
jgi:predicted transport protein